MTVPTDPRPRSSKRVDEVSVTLVDASSLGEFEAAIQESKARAIDTETVYTPGAFTSPNGAPGALRVISAATRDIEGLERAWVIDTTMVDRSLLARALSGVTADAWNADFDSLVLDRDLFEPARHVGNPVQSITWWDAQIADALLHQGRTGFSFYHGLAWAVEWYLGLSAEGKGTTQLSYTETEALSDEQVMYAAADAVETLWVAEEIRTRIQDEGLSGVCRLEQDARPFLDHMERVGLPFDWSSWEQRLQAMEQQRVQVSTELAELTGGGQASLFGETLEPAWNPASEHQAKQALNDWSTAEVLKWSGSLLGEERLLQPTDPLTANVLSEIGGSICALLLEYRELSKIISTYGESIREHIDDHGRMHPEYLQVVGTNTGRLASRRPNAQNFSPKMKEHIRPLDPSRVFVYSDLSQAELRFATQVAGDMNLKSAFVKGEDIHSATAERMFGVNMESLRDTQPEQYNEYRDKAKRVNFGIVYGQRGGGLARSLSQSGVKTSEAEGGALLDQYLGAYPQIASWVSERDKFVEQLATSHKGIDWNLTLHLHKQWPLVRQAVRQHRHEHRNWPTAEEVTERLGASWSIDEVAWTLSFEASIVIDDEGGSFGFNSFTKSGRRQQFTFHTEGVLEQAAKIIMSSSKAGPRKVRELVATQQKINLDKDGQPLSTADINKVLEDRKLRKQIVEEVEASMGSDAFGLLLDKSLNTRISQMANAYRNAPIQGGVADIMLEAYGLLNKRLASFSEAFGVQTVHDSVVVECNRDEAPAIASMVKATMEEAMRIWCPDIPAQADTDIRSTLSDRDVIETI